MERRPTYLVVMICAISAAIIPASDGAPSAPTFRVASSRSAGAAPEIGITFADGTSDTFVLRRYSPYGEAISRSRSRSEGCNFVGRLASDPDSAVAVTGCNLLGSDGKMQVTLLSDKYITGGSKFVVDASGRAVALESAFAHADVRSETRRVPPRGNATISGPDSGFHLVDGDEEVNSAMEAAEMAAEAACAEYGCTLPTQMTVVIQFGYEASADAFFGDSATADAYIATCLAHVQAHFMHASFPTALTVQAHAVTLRSDGTWTAENNLDDARAIAATDATVDLTTWICKDPAFYGVIGIAYVGAACLDGYKTSLNEIRSNEVDTAEVLAHELGHNLGLWHDFDSRHDGKGCTDCGCSIMDYVNGADSWSICSRADFEAAFYSKSWSGTCLDVSDDGGEPPCYNFNWRGDDYCDDENNVESCQWDGGDCCGNTKNGWDNYCTDCACLDPNPPPPPPVCEFPDWMGDDYCDDENNVESCQWDGGDCCDNNMDGWDNYCTVCACLDPNVTPSVCQDAEIGDGYCNDVNNVAECEFDGGDCCNNPFRRWDKSCTACECLDPNALTCDNLDFMGDGFCDDANNVETCQFDGGDCCNNTGEDWDFFCTVCSCLETV